MYAGVSSIFAGKVVGNLPDGLTSPDKISTKAFPNSWPANHVCTMALALFAQGIWTGEPVLIIKVVFWLASNIASINLFWLEGKLKSALSFPSVSQSELVPTTNITSSALAAVSTASLKISTWSGAWQPIYNAGKLPSKWYWTSIP